jgi:hypothetical protein
MTFGPNVVQRILVPKQNLRTSQPPGLRNGFNGGTIKTTGTEIDTNSVNKGVEHVAQL